MRLTLTISEVATLQKLVHDRIRVISEETAFEADRRNDNQLSGLVKLGKKLKRQTDHDKDKRRGKEKNKGKACGDKESAPDGRHPAEPRIRQPDTGEQHTERET